MIHSRGNKHLGFLQQCPHYRLNPVTMQFMLLFSSCTIAPSAWKQQSNYNPCFVFTWSTIFNTALFRKISSAAFCSDILAYVADMRCYKAVLITVLLSKHCCVGTVCICRNSVIFHFNGRIRIGWNTSSAELNLPKHTDFTIAKMFWFQWKFRWKQDYLSSEAWGLGLWPWVSV